MIFEYHKQTGIIYNGMCSREIKKGHGSMFETKMQRCFIGDDGKPVVLPADIDTFICRDTDISMEYLLHLRDQNRHPYFKFLFKKGKPIKIIPINGTMPKTWMQGRAA